MLKYKQSGIGLFEMIIVIGIVGVIVVTMAEIYSRDLRTKQKQKELNNISRTINQLVKFSTRINHLSRSEIAAGKFIFSELHAPGASGIAGIVPGGITAVFRVTFNDINQYKWMLSTSCPGGILRNTGDAALKAEETLFCDFKDSFGFGFQLDYVEYDFTRPWVNYSAVTRQVNNMAIHIHSIYQEDLVSLRRLETMLKAGLEEFKIDDFAIKAWLTEKNPITGNWEKVSNASGHHIKMDDFLSHNDIRNKAKDYGALYEIRPSQTPALVRDGSVRLDLNSKLCWEGNDLACIGQIPTGIKVDGALETGGEINAAGNINSQGDIKADGDINADGDIASQGDILASGNILAANGIINTTRFKNNRVIHSTIPLTRRYIYIGGNNIKVPKPDCPRYQGHLLDPKLTIGISSFVGTEKVNLSGNSGPTFWGTCDTTTGAGCLGFVSAVVSGFRNNPGDTAKFWDVSTVIGGAIDDDFDGIKNPKSVSMLVTVWCEWQEIAGS